MSRRSGLSVASKPTSRELPSLRHLPQLRKSRHVRSWISTRQRVSAPCGRFLYVLVILRIFTITTVRIFTIISIFPGHPAHIYHHAKIVCAYLPSPLRIFTITSAHIYHHLCAYLPSQPELSTGFDLGVYPFPLVA